MNSPSFVGGPGGNGVAVGVGVGRGVDVAVGVAVWVGVAVVATTGAAVPVAVVVGVGRGGVTPLVLDGVGRGVSVVGRGVRVGVGVMADRRGRHPATTAAPAITPIAPSALRKARRLRRGGRPVLGSTWVINKLRS
jgi:hypothetical protein